MQDGNKPPFGEEEAKRLLDVGWRQAIAFKLSADLKAPIPFDHNVEWLVVCTQSCSVVSDRLKADPYVELVVAKPIANYRAKAQEATGKNTRRFHLPIAGVDGIQAVECDINRRFFLAREDLLRLTPNMEQQIPSAAKAFAGWMSRYYTRTALPNELVVRARVKEGLFEIIKEALDFRLDEDLLVDQIDAIYVSWDPDSELEAGVGSYQMRLLFLCKGTAAETKLGELLVNPLERFEEEGGRDGIQLRWDVKGRTTTFVSELDGYHRLSEWDYLTDLGRVAEDNDALGA